MVLIAMPFEGLQIIDVQNRLFFFIYKNLLDFFNSLLSYLEINSVITKHFLDNTFLDH